MTREETNALTLCKYHQILSCATDRLYIDDSYSCYLFQAGVEADDFCAKAKARNISLYRSESPEFLQQRSFISLCYGMGIDTIHTKTSKEEKYKDIKVVPDDAKKQFYNPETVRNIIFLKQTHKKKYLRAISDSQLISPVLLDDRKAGEYPAIHYSYAAFDEKTHYLLFTTLQEFNAWNSQQKESFFPNGTTLRSLNLVRDNNPVLINPLSDRLVLTHELVMAVTGPDSTENN